MIIHTFDPDMNLLCPYGASNHEDNNNYIINYETDKRYDCRSLYGI